MVSTSGYKELDSSTQEVLALGKLLVAAGQYKAAEIAIKNGAFVGRNNNCSSYMNSNKRQKISLGGAG